MPDTNPPPAPERMAEVQAVTDRARRGDEAAVPRLRELLAEFPALGEYHGDLANQAIAAWISVAAGADALLRESLSWKTGALRRELAGGSADAVLVLAADRVVVSWLSANYYAAMEANALAAREAPKLVAFRTKRRLQSDRSLTAALGALAALRRLLPPPAAAAAPPAGAASPPPPPLLPPLPAHATPAELANRVVAYFAANPPRPAGRHPEPAGVN